MTKGEFIRDLYLFAKERPEYIRFGQFIFNYIEETYGVARDVQFIDKVDCFYVDENVDKFIDCAYKRIFSYLTIEALEDGLTAMLDMTDDNETIEYCIDEGKWITLKSGEKTQPINQGQRLSFKGERQSSKCNNNIGTFAISKKCNLKGNCMSLLFGDNANKHKSLEGYNYVFSYLFAWCSNIVDIEANFLPATTLADYCYTSMFSGCTSLVTAPELPATILTSTCYAYMFNGCTSLVTAPTILPATTLSDYCYDNMFHDCTSLVTAPELPATTLNESCYQFMFYGCSKLNNITMLATDISASGCLYAWVYGVASIGTLIKNPLLKKIENDLYRLPEKWTMQDYK